MLKPRAYGLFWPLWGVMTPRRRIHLVLLLVLSVVVSLAEMFSIGATLPFLTVLLSPDGLGRAGGAMEAFRRFLEATGPNVTLAATLMFSGAVAFASVLRFLFLTISTRLAGAIASELGARLYQQVLQQSYMEHVTESSSNVIDLIISKVNTTANVIYQYIVMISTALISISILAALLALDPLVASVACGSIGCCYFVVGMLTRKLLRANSRMIAVENTSQLKTLQEGLGGIRDVLLDGAQSVYCNAFRAADQRLRKAMADNAIISGSPRYLMETIGTVLIAAIAYQLSHRSGGFAEALPVLGVLAISAQRLLPALQQGFAAWAIISGSHESAADAVERLSRSVSDLSNRYAGVVIELRQELRLEEISFRYAPDADWALHGLDLTISKGSRVGFIGQTGGGKSTLLDLIMGLLVPVQGRILVDGHPITGSAVLPWQKSIAHVPQAIFLSDASIAENIAFGVQRDQINFDRVQRAARQAQIADFIEGRTLGYDEIVGERGVRLSGGQRQRIGIARALYKQSTVLVFDEATSALDTATEQSVMGAIRALDGDLTILMISHRLPTLMGCDVIYEIRDGRAVCCGSYEDLVSNAGSRNSVLGSDQLSLK